MKFAKKSIDFCHFVDVGKNVVEKRWMMAELYVFDRVGGVL